MDESLNRHVLNHLVEGFESCVVRRRISEFRSLYPPWLTTAILETGAYTPRGVDPDRLIKTDNGEEGGDGYRAVWKEGGKHYYYVPGLKPIEAKEDDLRVYDFEHRWLPDWLARQIGDIQSSEVLLDRQIWFLGEPHGMAVILVRGLGHIPTYEKIYDCLAERIKRPALVLSHRSLQSPRLPMPKGHQVVALDDLFKESTTPNFKPWLPKGGGLEWNPEAGELSWGDRLPLKGKGKRKEFYSRLYEAGYDYGQPKLEIVTLLRKIGVAPMTMDQYLSGSKPHLQDYIDFDEDECWLRYFVE